MKAAWYEKQGAAQDVLIVGDMPDPEPAQGEVRIRVAASGINPGDTKKRGDTFGVGMPYPLVIPHSDGAGVIDKVGEGVDTDLVGKRVWCFGAQSYRPFGTAAEFTVVPLDWAIPLADDVSFETGACLGIPGITAHRAVNVAGPVKGKTVLVQGAAGSVGLCAVQLARFGGASVIGTVRDAADEAIAYGAGAHKVLMNDSELIGKIQAAAPDGVDHIVEVAFAANIECDIEALKSGGTLASYATNQPQPVIPFWPMVFKNIQLNFLGSDDFPLAAKIAATTDVNAALVAGWAGPAIGERIPLSEVARAHELTDRPQRAGRVILVT